jgi:hypothetical protein
LRYGINYPRNCMAQSNAARTLISFCMNLSSIVLVAMLLMQLVSCVRCTFVFVCVGSIGSPDTVYEPDAPPRVTEAKTGGAALGPIVLSLLFLLAVELMLEPLLLPLDEDGPTEDLVYVV